MPIKLDTAAVLRLYIQIFCCLNPLGTIYRVVYDPIFLEAIEDKPKYLTPRIFITYAQNLLGYMIDVPVETQLITNH